MQTIRKKCINSTRYNIEIGKILKIIRINKTLNKQRIKIAYNFFIYLNS